MHSGKVLFVATIDDHFRCFHLPYLRWFKEQGFEVHVAASGDASLPYVDQKYNIPVQRSPFRMMNAVAYKKLKSIIKRQRYDVIHCHTPMGGVLARLAARKMRKRGTKVLYTAHGFHFYKGAPLFSWLLYYPVERMLARYTDCLIAINHEDYELAVRQKFKSRRIERVHGVGVDTTRFKPISQVNKDKLRRELGFSTDEFLLFYAAEFNKNKNQQLLIRALSLIRQVSPSVRLLLAGDGPLLEQCRLLAGQLGVQPFITFLGYRDDVAQLLPMCDAAVSSSFREGLPVNIIESMACGLPVIATQNRGHAELIKDHVNGYLIPCADIYMLADRINRLRHNESLCRSIGENNVIRAQDYSLNTVLAQLSEIYANYIVEDWNEPTRQYYRAYI